MTCSALWNVALVLFSASLIRFSAFHPLLMVAWFVFVLFVQFNKLQKMQNPFVYLVQILKLPLIFWSHSQRQNIWAYFCNSLVTDQQTCTCWCDEHTPLSWSQSGEEAPLHWLRGPRRGDTWPELHTESASSGLQGLTNSSPVRRGVEGEVGR